MSDTSPRLVIATMTLARTPEAADELLAALTTLSATGLRVAVTDGGSPASFIRAMSALPGVEVHSSGAGAGLVHQIRTSLQTARSWQPDRILYTEPDKQHFFAHGLGDFLDVAGRHPQMGIVLAARTASSFSTYPVSQQHAERVLNQLCREATGVDADWSFGPFILTPSLADYVCAVPREVGWGWRPYLFVLAGRLGLDMLSVAGPHDCPAGHCEDSADEREHRLAQLAQNISGVRLARQARLTPP